MSELVFEASWVLIACVYVVLCRTWRTRPSPIAEAIARYPTLGRP